MKKAFTFLAVIFMAHCSFATIHYTYVYEDAYNATRSYDIDLDGDNDFSFDYNIVGYSYYVHCLKATSFFAANGTSGTTPKAYAASAGMGTYHWESGDAMVVGNGAPFDGTEKYLQVKFSNGTNNYYGWIRLNGTNGSLYITGYAYNDVADAPIGAGEGYNPNTGINEVNAALFKLTSINKNQISFSNTDAFDHVKVYSTDGKLVTEISKPSAGQVYDLQQNTGILLVSFFKKNELLYTSKQFVQ